MGVNIGIVGLPNVGKSTLYKSLTSQDVDIENYPFCTIEPNKGIVPVHDYRLDKVAKISNSKEIIYSVIEFVDIAGIVKGASQGAGLGNKFLSNIRETNLILHVVRDFEVGDIIHVEGKVDPRNDIDTINSELILRDIETIDTQVKNIKQKLKEVKEKAKIRESLSKMLEFFDMGKPIVKMPLSGVEEVDKFRKGLHLLTDKEIIYLINTDKDSSKIDLNEYKKSVGLLDDDFVMFMDIKLECDISILGEEERAEYMEEFSLKMTGLEEVVQNCFKKLGLISFFTSGDKETRSWTIKRGVSIKEAAGVIHRDFSENFIAADVVSFKDFVEYNGWQEARKNGKVRQEGKDYIVQDADIVVIKHNS